MYQSHSRHASLIEGEQTNLQTHFSIPQVCITFVEQAEAVISRLLQSFASSQHFSLSSSSIDTLFKKDSSIQDEEVYIVSFDYYRLLFSLFVQTLLFRNVQASKLCTDKEKEKRDHAPFKFVGQFLSFATQALEEMIKTNKESDELQESRELQVQLLDYILFICESVHKFR